MIAQQDANTQTAVRRCVERNWWLALIRHQPEADQPSLIATIQIDDGSDITVRCSAETLQDFLQFRSLVCDHCGVWLIERNFTHVSEVDGNGGPRAWWHAIAAAWEQAAAEGEAVR